MAAEVLLVVLTEFLISKVTSNYIQPFSGSPYVIQDPRSQNTYTLDYQTYYPNYATKATQPTYQRPAGAMAPVKRPAEYRPKAADFLSPSIQKPVEFRPPMHQTNVFTPIEFRPQMHNPVEFLPPGTQSHQRVPEVKPKAQSPVEYRPIAFQQLSELVSPIEFRSPPYQKAAEKSPTFFPLEFRTPTCQNIPDPPTQAEFHQPSYQKIAEFVAKQRSVDQPICYTSSDLTAPKLQSTQSIPIPSSIIRALQTPGSSSQLPVLTPQALDTLKSLGFPKSMSLPKKPCSDTLDSNVLNNLAIALQLLIVNNIINQPKSESVDTLNLSDSLLELAYPSEVSVGNSYSFDTQSPCEMSNAKFLGSSNFGDDSIMSKGMLGLTSLGSGFPLPRPGLNLMSPYDAIAASSLSPFSESTPSLFSLKNSFQSPYAAIMAADNNRDLFSMSDIF